jgi:peptide chain release factor subunit 1
MAVTVTWETLRELAGFRSEQGLALTLYLDLDPSTSPTPAAVDTRFNSLLTEVEKRHLSGGDDAQRRRAIRANLERVREWWEGDFDRDGARSMAVFVSAVDSYWRELALPEPVRDHFHLDRDLSLAPLVAQVSGLEGTLVAVMNRERGQVFRLRAGRLEEILDGSDEVPGQHDQGGWSQARYQRHIQKLVLEHLKAVGDEIDKRVRRARGPQLVIVAPEELRPEIEAALATETREAIVGWATAEAHAGPSELVEVARPVLDRAHALREQEAVERFREELGRNARACAGWQDTLEAASDARVEQLLVAEGPERPAYRCPGCGRASTEAGSCPLDGTQLEEHDGLELAVHHTLAQGGTVLTVAGDVLGGEGIGALLRF